MLKPEFYEVRSFNYIGSKEVVRTGSECSSLYPVKLGIPQGSFLGLALFMSMTCSISRKILPLYERSLFVSSDTSNGADATIADPDAF